MKGMFRAKASMCRPEGQHAVVINNRLHFGFAGMEAVSVNAELWNFIHPILIFM
jgi:hypothetical protein